MVFGVVGWGCFGLVVVCLVVRGALLFLLVGGFCHFLGFCVFVFLVFCVLLGFCGYGWVRCCCFVWFFFFSLAICECVGRDVLFLVGFFCCLGWLDIFLWVV